ncbi:hypothetical protein IGI04_015364, partial [Brassica rapa subsp. trilocularis]
MTKSKPKKKAKITEQQNPPQTLPPDLRLPPRLFATDRFPINDYNCQNQAVVSVTFRFEAPQTTLRPVKAVEDVHRRLCSLSYPKGARSYASEGPKDYNLLGNKPQDIVRPGSLSLLAEAYDRCVQVCAKYAKTFYLGWDLLLLSLL